MPEFFSLRLPDDLPIFAQDHLAYRLFYAPGYLAAVDANTLDDFESDLVTGVPGRWPQVAELRRHASAAQQTWGDRLSRPFAPLCLTLYLNNECNLRCTYCYAMPSRRAGNRLTVEAVQPAAELVATNCRKRNRPFTVVFHGGGEPTLHRDQVDSILMAVRQVAGAHEISLFRYVATNGVMSASKATWLAGQFDVIGLSCDGPEEIQAQQRPCLNGKPSTPFVEQTAQVVHDMGKILHVRVTVTPQTVRCQAEIAEYLCQRLKPQEIHVEPVYRVGRASADDYESFHDASEFVTEFLRGRVVAQRYGVRWLTSGSRPGEVHGPYCQVFRDVLNLVPGAGATACLKITHADTARAQRLAIGTLDTDQRFTLNQDRVHELRARLSQEATRCLLCFNRYHCARGCPENCPLEREPQSFGFRCQMQQALTDAYLQEAAATLHTRDATIHGVAGQEIGDL